MPDYHAGQEVWLRASHRGARVECLMQSPATVAKAARVDKPPADYKVDVTLPDGRGITVRGDELTTTPPGPAKPRHVSRRGALDPKVAEEPPMFS